MRGSRLWSVARRALSAAETTLAITSRAQHFRKRAPFAAVVGDDKLLIGRRALAEAERLGMDVKRVFAVRDADCGVPDDRGASTGSVSVQLARHVAGRTVAAGELVVQLRLPSRTAVLSGRPRRLLVIDGVQEPANVAALVRSAVNFGWSDEVWIVGAADPYSPKVVEAAQMLVLRARVVFGTRDECQSRLRDLGVLVLVADVRLPPSVPVEHRGGIAFAGAADGVANMDEAQVAMVLSAEGLGPDSAWASYPRAVIPLDEQSESLNVGVAGTILMNALRPSRSDDVAAVSSAASGLSDSAVDP